MFHKKYYLYSMYQAQNTLNQKVDLRTYFSVEKSCPHNSGVVNYTDIYRLFNQISSLFLTL